MYFFKLLAANLLHLGFQYKEGLNVDTVPFQAVGQCRPGGLYFTDLDHIWLYAWDGWPLIADVSLPPDARVHHELCGTKWKADRIELSNIRPISQFLSQLSEQRLSYQVIRNWYLFSQLQPQPEAVCIAVMQEHGDWLPHVREQTEAICLAAVRSYWCALRQVKVQTPAICTAAVQTHCCAIQYVKEPTPELKQLVATQGCVAHRVKNPFI